MPPPRPENSLAFDSSSLEPSEAFQVLSAEAEGRTGRFPHADLARRALEVTAGGDFPVQRAALEALLRRVKSAREAEGFKVVSRPRGKALLGAYRVTAGTSSYRLLLRSFHPATGSCDCPDFLRSGLTLCKHLLWLLDSTLRGLRPGSPVPGALPPRTLEWDPVRPLDGAGDWLERVSFNPGPPTARKAGAAIPLVQARLARWFRAGPAPRTLARAFADQPARRLALVTELEAWARAQRGTTPAVDPPLLPLLRREIDRLSPQVNGVWTERERGKHLGSLKRALFPYQQEGVRRFLAAERLLLADDMGLGKTAQAIASCHALFSSGRVKKGLVVVPAALKPQWLREWRSFSDVPVELVEGNPAERARLLHTTSAGFLIVNYEQVLRDLPQLVRFNPQVVVLDEAQRIKNWATKTAAYVKRLSPRYRLVLTGTPMENRLDELASLMDWVDDLALEPKWRLGPWHSSFADGAREVMGARNLGTLRTRIAPCSLRRIRKEVLAQLPPRTDTRLPVAMTPEQQAAHDELSQPIASMMQRATRRPLTQAEFLKLMSLLTQQRILCNGLAQRDFEQTWPTLEKSGPPTEAVLKGLFSPKLLELRELISQLVSIQGRKVVVFSQWRRMLRLAEWATSDLLNQANARAVYFSGEEGQNRRTQNLVDFHDDPRTRVLFATDAGGVGLNLQKAASACIHLDLPWNPAVLEQRTGRIYRLGQTQPVAIYYLMSASGIEARISGVVGDKKALFDGLFDGDRDEVRFERGGSFLSTVQRLIEPVVVPDLPVGDEEDPLPEAAPAELRDTAPSTPEQRPAQAPSPVAALSGAPPPPGPEAIQALFRTVRMEQTPDGGLRLEAPREAAQTLASLLSGFATLLQTASRDSQPG